MAKCYGKLEDVVNCITTYQNAIKINNKHYLAYYKLGSY